MSENRRVLIVEECADSREMYAIGFHLAGFEVLAAGTISEAFGFLEVCDVDVIVCDLRLGDQSGLEIVRRLRERGRGVAYALTGAPDERSRADAVGAGCADVLLKPVPPDELIARIASSHHDRLAASRDSGPLS